MLQGLATRGASALRTLILLGVLLLGSSHLGGMCANYPAHAGSCKYCRACRPGRTAGTTRGEMEDYLEEILPGVEIACRGGLTLGGNPPPDVGRPDSRKRGAGVESFLDSRPLAGSPSMPLDRRFGDIIDASGHRVIVLLAGSNDTDVLYGKLTSSRVAEWIISHVRSIVTRASCRHVVLSSILPRLGEGISPKAARKDRINSCLQDLVRKSPVLLNRNRKACKIHFLDFRAVLPYMALDESHRCPEKAWDQVHLRGSVMGEWLGRLGALVDGACGGSPVTHRRGARGRKR